MEITIDANGMPSFTLNDLSGALSGDGTERIGFGISTGVKPNVTFQARSIQQNAASLAEGRPVFKSVVFMRLQHPGERDTVERPATRQDVMRFPAEYRRYCQGRADIPDGTPLEVIWPNHPDIVKMLQYHMVFTVEQLQTLNDTQLQNIGMGAWEWQQKARNYIAAVEKGQGFAQYEERDRRNAIEIQRLTEQNMKMAQQLQAMMNQLANMQSGQMMQAGLTNGGMASPMAAAPAVFQPPIVLQNGMMPAAPYEIGADEHTPPAGMSAQEMAAAELERLAASSNEVFQEDLTATPSAGRPTKGKK